VGADVNPVLLRREIGRRLRVAREAAGLTMIEAADRLAVARSTMSRIETGIGSVSVHLARSMMGLYRWEDDDLLDLVRTSRRPGWWKQYGFSDRHFIALESGADRLSTFQPDLVHGLLQTADYARAVFSVSRVSRSEVWIDNQLDVRMIRQERLVDDDQPLELRAVISEFALRRPVGGAAVMRAQLRHLVLITELPTVTLQVLPASVVSEDAMYGAFVVLDFPAAEQPSILHLEHVLGPEGSEKPEQVAAARLRLDHLRSLALVPEESVEVIEWVADRLWATE
jgi:transcriptional regulator with XRE-family HTH domain